MKRYRGAVTDHGSAVTVEDEGGCRGLDPRRDLRDHSPAGFSWGFAGSGPAQLALALAADATGDDDRARAAYQRLKARLVAALPAEGWELTERQVLDAVRDAERERSAGAGRDNTLHPCDGPAPCPLARRIDRHLGALSEYPAVDAAELESVMRERGWMEAVRHLAARGGLSHPGAVEAGKLVAASEDWLREQGDEPAAGFTR